MCSLTREGRLFSRGFIGQNCADKTIILHAEAICKNPHKKRGVVAWKKVGVCWLCIPHQLAVSPFTLPDQFALFACLLIFRAAPARCALAHPLRRRGLQSCEIATLLSSCVSQDAVLHSFSNAWTRKESTRRHIANEFVFFFNVFLLEYIWFAVQLAASRGLHAESASHSKVKTCTMYYV